MLSPIRFFATPLTVAHQAPLAMEFSRQEYWCGVLFPSPQLSGELRVLNINICVFIVSSVTLLKTFSCSESTGSRIKFWDGHPASWSECCPLRFTVHLRPSWLKDCTPSQTRPDFSFFHHTFQSSDTHIYMCVYIYIFFFTYTCVHFTVLSPNVGFMRAGVLDCSVLWPKALAHSSF